MVYRARAADVLAEWRDVERRLAESHDPAEIEAFEAEAARLRDEYQRLVEDALRAQLPEPPPFPSS